MDENTFGINLSSIYGNQTGYQTPYTTSRNFLSDYRTGCLFRIWKDRSFFVGFLRTRKGNNCDFPQHYSHINSFLAGFADIFTFEFPDSVFEKIINNPKLMKNNLISLETVFSFLPHKSCRSPFQFYSNTAHGAIKRDFGDIISWDFVCVALTFRPFRLFFFP